MNITCTNLLVFAKQKCGCSSLQLVRNTLCFEKSKEWAPTSIPASLPHASLAHASQATNNISLETVKFIFRGKGQPHTNPIQHSSGIHVFIFPNKMNLNYHPNLINVWHDMIYVTWHVISNMWYNMKCKTYMWHDMWYDMLHDITCHDNMTCDRHVTWYGRHDMWYVAWHVIWNDMWHDMLHGMWWHDMWYVAWHVIWNDMCHDMLHGMWYDMICGMTCDMEWHVTWSVTWYVIWLDMSYIYCQDCNLIGWKPYGKNSYSRLISSYNLVISYM